MEAAVHVLCCDLRRCFRSWCREVEVKSFERYLTESLRSRVSCRTYHIYPRFSRRLISAWFRRGGGPPRCLAKTNRIECPQGRTDKTGRAEHRTRTAWSKIGVGLPSRMPHLVDAAPPDEPDGSALHGAILPCESAQPVRQLPERLSGTLFRGRWQVSDGAS